MPFKDDVKQWFETGDFPTQAQFYQKFEWLRWKDEKIAAGDLTVELLNIINSFARLITLPPGVYQTDIRRGTLLEKFLLFDYTVGQLLTVSIGITPGGTELVNNEPINTANKQEGLFGKDYYCFEDTVLYFTVTGAIAPDSISFNIYKS